MIGSRPRILQVAAVGEAQLHDILEGRRDGALREVIRDHGAVEALEPRVAHAFEDAVVGVLQERLQPHHRERRPGLKATEARAIATARAAAT